MSKISEIEDRLFLESIEQMPRDMLHELADESDWLLIAIVVLNLFTTCFAIAANRPMDALSVLNLVIMVIAAIAISYKSCARRYIASKTRKPEEENTPPE